MKGSNILLLLIVILISWNTDPVWVAADETPPQAPTDFSAYSKPQHSWSITFYWTPPPDSDLERYEMDVTGTPCESLKETHCGIYEIPRTTTGWTYHNANLGQHYSYYFRLRAVDSAGNFSDWTRTLFFVSTDVNDESVTPVNFELLPNYPNPFNASTQIGFTLSQPASVRLAIYDVLGRSVRRLQSAVLPAGEQSVTWDGLADHGERVGSGVYFYRIEVEGQVDVRKMVLLK
jgi:hypothetical protein